MDTFTTVLLGIAAFLLFLWRRAADQVATIKYQNESKQKLGEIDGYKAEADALEEELLKALKDYDTSRGNDPKLH